MAESIAHFAIKSIGLSRVNGRKPCTLLNAARHNLREIQAEQGATGRIDPARTHGNTILQGAALAADVQALATNMLADAGVDSDKLRRDHCQAIEAVFSLPPHAAIADPAAYFRHCLVWLTGALSLPVLSAVVHHDETVMHLHVLLLPLQDGQHVGSKPIDRAALKRLRENFFIKVAAPVGLKRTGAKMRGIGKQWAIAAVLQRCAAMGLPAVNGALWPVFEAAIKHDPTAAMLALGIDPNTIKPSDINPTHEPTLNPKITLRSNAIANITHEPTPNPIGITSNPIGIQKEGVKHQSLSCVGFDRLHRARQAEQSAIARHTQSATTTTTPAPPIGDDGYTRERDEYAHDLSAWD